MIATRADSPSRPEGYQGLRFWCSVARAQERINPSTLPWSIRYQDLRVIRVWGFGS